MATRRLKKYHTPPLKVMKKVMKKISRYFALKLLESDTFLPFRQGNLVAAGPPSRGVQPREFVTRCGGAGALVLCWERAPHYWYSLRTSTGLNLHETSRKFFMKIS